MSRVLSIQSHVVSGYVGNKSATFPLQVLGFEVDSIMSVQFSNHTGYGLYKGHVLNSDDLEALIGGLRANDLIDYTHLLTGYIGSDSFLLKVRDVITELKRTCPGLIYVCDPVMGDLGKMYVPKELLPLYQKEIVPLADILTPNQFEAELLTGIKIDSIDTAKEALTKLHEMGAKTVVLSSTELGTEDTLICLASSAQNGTCTRVKLSMPRLPQHFTGTGDLFAALLLAWNQKHPLDLKLVCEKTVSTMQHVLNRTVKAYEELVTTGKKPTCKHIELKLIQSKRDIEDPEICVHADTF